MNHLNFYIWSDPITIIQAISIKIFKKNVFNGGVNNFLDGKVVV